MSGFAIALYLHLLSLLLAVAAFALSGYTTVRQRTAGTAEEALEHAALTERFTRAFPVATAGLLLTGFYMAWDDLGRGWVVASIVGLALIVLLGAGVEGGVNRAAVRELRENGMSARARGLLASPVSWTAQATSLTLILGVVLIMVGRPGAVASTAILVVAVLLGVVGAVPLWRPRRTPRTEQV